MQYKSANVINMLLCPSLAVTEGSVPHTDCTRLNICSWNSTKYRYVCCYTSRLGLDTGLSGRPELQVEGLNTFQILPISLSGMSESQLYKLIG